MIKEDWFKDWFDSPYYHILYKNRDKAEAQDFIRRLMNHFNVRLGQKIIDIACGKGRHSSFINALGFDVTGIDLSPESIKFARQYETDNLSFAVHDMRDTFKAENFDIGLNLFTSFGYFVNDEDNQKAIQSMANNLKKGGHLVIDFLNVHKVITTLPSQETKYIDGIEFQISKSLINNFITKEINFTDNGKSHHFKEHVKNISKTTFEHYLNNSGLEIIHTFGDYKLNEFNQEQSERLILISRKLNL
jgi:SAM-dependent methyltransferase